ncbi:MAG: hypothetical protein RL022_357 [Chloroflexota bacterium]
MTAGIKVAYPVPLPDPSLNLRSLHSAETTALPTTAVTTPLPGSPPPARVPVFPKRNPHHRALSSGFATGFSFKSQVAGKGVGKQLPRSPGPRQHANKTYHVKVDAFLVGMEPVAGAVVK